MKVKTFVFNSFQVNTYLIQNTDKEAIIIDPACQNTKEQNELTDYIEKEGLSVKMALNTHAHIDHILSNDFVRKTFKCPLLAHKSTAMDFKMAPRYAGLFAIDSLTPSLPDGDLKDGQTIAFGSYKIEVFYTPGHADGSVCFYIPSELILFSGDVLFNGTIGRTDLPGGNFNTLIHSIQSKLFTLPDQTVVYPGHGSPTSIGAERNENPFFN